jgi:hypothetical protein
MAEQEKIFCGSGKEFGNYGTINLKICLTDIPKEYITGTDKKYVRLKVQKKKSSDKFGNTHYVEIDTWKPERKEVKKDLNDINQEIKTKKVVVNFPDQIEELDNDFSNQLPF